MKTLVLLLTCLAAATIAECGDVDWSEVRPIEDFDHYWARLPSELQFLRRAIPNRRIVNGQEAFPGQFPYQVAILSTFPAGIGLCGATILTNSYILTAAHCVDGSSGGTAIVGAHNRVNDEPTQQRFTYDVDAMNIHAGYSLTNIRNDIATVRLNTLINFNERVQPIRLPARSDSRTFAGITGTISGYGRTTDDNSILSEVLMYTRNPVMTNADCLASWDNNAILIQPQNICQSGAGGRAACNSDSGGPLTVQDGDDSLQLGVVSFGTAVCADGMPTVFARVSYFLGWIEEHSDFVAQP